VSEIRSDMVALTVTELEPDPIFCDAVKKS
jgi:hypothetical protein